jgi:hypothetical protein
MTQNGLWANSTDTLSSRTLAQRLCPSLDGPSALRGSKRNLSGARAVSPFGIGFLTPCLKETAGIKFDGYSHRRERIMFRKLMFAAFVLAFAGGAALAQETCESKAVGKDGKPLAGAAKTSFVKKCMADTCATKAVSQDGKPLSGAAKTSFMKKCEKGA